MKKVRKSNLALVVAISLMVSLFVGCKSGSPKSVVTMADNTEDFSTDSIEFKEQVDSTLECNIIVDYPVGNDSLSMGMRRYIAQELKRLYLPISNKDGNEVSPLGYKGSLENGKLVLDYYGNGTMTYLKEQYNELSTAVEGDAPSMSFYAGVRKMAENKSYITYQTNYYTYLGGAHGSAGSYQANIIRSTGEVLATVVDTLKVKEVQPILRKYIVEYFKKGGDTEVADNNLSDYLFIENGIIPLPTFATTLTDDGVYFIYQQYEIGPYALGMIDFTVPYAEIKPFMTKEALDLIK